MEMHSFTPKYVQDAQLAYILDLRIASTVPNKLKDAQYAIIILNACSVLMVTTMTRLLILA